MPTKGKSRQKARGTAEAPSTWPSPRWPRGCATCSAPSSSRRWLGSRTRGSGASVRAGDLEPTRPAQQRLRFAYDLLYQVEAAEGSRDAQTWATSVNPRLDYGTPLKAIREDRFQDTAAAAKALMEDAYDG